MKNNSKKNSKKPQQQNELAPHAVANALHALALSNQALHARLPPPPKNSAKGAVLLAEGGDEGHKALVAVKRLMADEEKAFYYSIGGDEPDWTWSGIDLTTLITQGVNDDERVGDALRLLAVDLRWQAYLVPNPSIILSTQFRIVVTQSVDEAVTANDVFDPIVGATNQAVFAQHPWDQRKQYRVLYDRTHNLRFTAAVQSTIGYWSALIAHDEVTLKINRRVQYESNGATVEKGALQVWTCSSTPLANKSDNKFDMSARVRYTDA